MEEKEFVDLLKVAARRTHFYVATHSGSYVIDKKTRWLRIAMMRGWLNRWPTRIVKDIGDFIDAGATLEYAHPVLHYPETITGQDMRIIKRVKNAKTVRVSDYLNRLTVTERDGSYKSYDRSMAVGFAFYVQFESYPVHLSPKYPRPIRDAITKSPHLTAALERKEKLLLCLLWTDNHWQVGICKQQHHNWGYVIGPPLTTQRPVFSAKQRDYSTPLLCKANCVEEWRSQPAGEWMTKTGVPLNEPRVHPHVERPFDTLCMRDGAAEARAAFRKGGPKEMLAVLRRRTSVMTYNERDTAYTPAVLRGISGRLRSGWHESGGTRTERIVMGSDKYYWVTAAQGWCPRSSVSMTTMTTIKAMKKGAVWPAFSSGSPPIGAKEGIYLGKIPNAIMWTEKMRRRVLRLLKKYRQGDSK